MQTHRFKITLSNLNDVKAGLLAVIVNDFIKKIKGRCGSSDDGAKITANIHNVEKYGIEGVIVDLVFPNRRFRIEQYVLDMNGDGDLEFSLRIDFEYTSVEKFCCVLLDTIGENMGVGYDGVI